RAAQNVVEGGGTRADQRCDALRSLRVCHSGEESVVAVEDTRIRRDPTCQTSEMALARRAYQNGLDREARAQSLLDQARPLNADPAIRGGFATTQGRAVPCATRSGDGRVRPDLHEASRQPHPGCRGVTLAAELLQVSAEAPEPSAIRYAAEFIARGRVVGIPTDTFYGLAADPFNLAAVERIYRAKGRPETRALPILVNSIEQAATLARELPVGFLRLAQKFWPGALTLLVDASNHLPLKVTGNTGRVALRWPNSRVACTLIDLLENPITGTSANLSGLPSCSSAQQLLQQMGDRLPLVLDAGDT